MKAFTVLEGVAAPLLRPNINTDIIIRIERLRDLQRDELGPYAFESWRYRRDGTEDPSFVLNKPQYREARIMIGGENSPGSSRRRRLAPKLRHSLRDRAERHDLLHQLLPEQVCRSSYPPGRRRLRRQVRRRKAEGHHRLHRCVVISPSGKETPFTIDAMLREAMLEGLDQIELTRAREPQIAAFQARDRVRHPWLYLPPRQG
jgi:3-isopropylmalate/(R)-2-methylmalate dehydratase small subunit